MSVLDHLRHRRPVVQPDSPAARQESFHSTSIIGIHTTTAYAALAWRRAIKQMKKHKQAKKTEKAQTA